MDPTELELQMVRICFFIHVCFVLVFLVLRAEFVLVGGVHVFVPRVCANRECVRLQLCVCVTVVTSELSFQVFLFFFSDVIRWLRLFCTN